MLGLFRRIAVPAFGAVAASAVLLGGVAPAALAQQSGPTALRDVKVWVNPEYDDAMKLGSPSVLVMMEGDIVGAEVPATVRFLVPSTASMYSAGSMDAGGTYIPPGDSLDRTPSVTPGWDEVSYELRAGTFRVEYYDPLANTTPRQVTYQLQRLYPIENLTVTVQEPKKSSDFNLSPAGVPGTDGEGHMIHSVTYTNLAVTTPVQFSISYRTKSASTLLLIVGLIIVAALLGGGGYYLAKKSGGASSDGRAVRKSARRDSAPARKSGAAPAYCSQCGRKLDRPGRFCPGCGAKV